MLNLFIKLITISLLYRKFKKNYKKFEKPIFKEVLEILYIKKNIANDHYYSIKLKNNLLLNLIKIKFNYTHYNILVLNIIWYIYLKIYVL